MITDQTEEHRLKEPTDSLTEITDELWTCQITITEDITLRTTV